MATTSKNVFQKLQQARTEFLLNKIDKSGKHMQLEYKYFSLDDIVPTATRIFNDIGLTTTICIADGIATARVFNSDKPEECTDFILPFTPISPIVSNSGKMVTNEMQATGASITYIRRYLWLTILDIVEPDEIDSGELGHTKPTVTEHKAPATAEQRAEIKKELTAPPIDSASEEQVAELKKLLKELMSLDEKQEAFVQDIALKTEGFSKITAEKCDKLIKGVSEMIAAYHSRVD